MATEQPDEGGVPTEATNDAGVALVWIGAGLVLASWLIFEIIIGEYFVTNTSVVLAASLIVLPRIAPKAVRAMAPLWSFVKLLGYGLVLSGLVEFLDDIRFEGLEDFVSILGALVAYAGYVVVFFGARAIND